MGEGQHSSLGQIPLVLPKIIHTKFFFLNIIIIPLLMEYRINTNTGDIFSKEEYFVSGNWPYGKYYPEIWEIMVPIETNEEEIWDLQEKMWFIYKQMKYGEIKQR